MNDRQDELLSRLGAHARERQIREANEPLGADFEADIAARIQKGMTAQPAAPRRRHAPLALAASLIAAVVLFVALQGGDSVTPLPGYVAEMRGGAQLRSESTGAALEVGDRFELVLRPDMAVDGPLTMVAFKRVGADLLPVDLPQPQWSADGAGRILAIVTGAAPFAVGTHDLVVVVARDGHVPDAATLLGDSGELADGPGYRALALSLEVAAP